MNMVGGPLWWETLGPGSLPPPKSGAVTTASPKIGFWRFVDLKNETSVNESCNQAKTEQNLKTLEWNKALRKKLFFVQISQPCSSSSSNSRTSQQVHSDGTKSRPSYNSCDHWSPYEECEVRFAYCWVEISSVVKCTPLNWKVVCDQQLTECSLGKSVHLNRPDKKR